MNTVHLFDIYEILRGRLSDDSKAKAVLFEILQVLETQPVEARSELVSTDGRKKLPVGKRFNKWIL